MPLRQHLSEHTITTAYERGWAKLANGELLAHAEATRIDLLIKTNQNLRYQQNLSERRLAILVLRSTSWPNIQRQLEAIQAAVERSAPGTYEEFEI